MHGSRSSTAALVFKRVSVIGHYAIDFFYRADGHFQSFVCVRWSVGFQPLSTNRRFIAPALIWRRTITVVTTVLGGDWTHGSICSGEVSAEWLGNEDSMNGLHNPIVKVRFGIRVRAMEIYDGAIRREERFVLRTGFRSSRAVVTISPKSSSLPVPMSMNGELD